MSVQEQIDRLIVHRAAEWLEVVRTGRIEEYPAFVRWIEESPRHLDEFLQLLALSREARNAVRGTSIDKATLLARLSHVTELACAVREPRAVPIAPRRWMRSVAALAAIAAAVTVVAAWQAGLFSPWQRYETGIGQQHTVELTDGSVVTLNARSEMLVRIGTSEREIQLVSGEALFHVAHDTQRPFRVHTRDAVVQAVGTQFDVATRLGGTRVTVLEGKVRVTSKLPSQRTLPDASGGDPTQPDTPIGAGEAVHISSLGIKKGALEEVAHATDWRQRRLVFDGTPLEEAVDEFNKYHQSMQLRLEGIAVGSRHYSGTFDADDLTSFLDLLSRERDLEVERRNDEVVIRARP